jgi:peptide/nickel transport system permease protein
MPAVSVALSLMCFYTRQLRADLIQQLRSEDYVTTARAKGAGSWRVLTHHAMRNSVFGLITAVALNFGTLLGVTVIIEEIFGLPGIGHELLSAINTRDVPVIEGAVFVFAFIVVLCNLIADLLYAALDPRVKYGSATD